MELKNICGKAKNFRSPREISLKRIGTKKSNINSTNRSQNACLRGRGYSEFMEAQYNITKRPYGPFPFYICPRIIRRNTIVLLILFARTNRKKSKYNNLGYHNAHCVKTRLHRIGHFVKVFKTNELIFLLCKAYIKGYFMIRPTLRHYDNCITTSLFGDHDRDISHFTLCKGSLK